MCDEFGNLNQKSGRPARVFRKAAVIAAGVIAGAALARGAGLPQTSATGGGAGR
jgi:hypothetical protein